MHSYINLHQQRSCVSAMYHSTLGCPQGECARINERNRSQPAYRGCHLPHLVLEREYNACATVTAPEQCSDLVFRVFMEPCKRVAHNCIN